MSQLASSKMMVMAAIAAISMGTIGVLARLSQLDAVSVTFFRLLIGGSLLVLLMLITGQRQLLARKPHPLILLNGVMLSGFMTFFIAALGHTTMLIAVMTLYMAPAVASVIAHFALNERLTRYSVSSIIVVLLGFVLVIYQPSDTQAPESSLLGYAFALTGMACYAGFIVLNKLIPEQIHEFTKCSWQFLVGALCVLPLFLQSKHTLSVEQLGWLLVIGLVPGFLGIILAVYSIKRLPAATYSTISYVEPISAVMLGWAVFQESLSLTQFLGCAIIVLAGIAQGVKPNKQATVPATG